MKQARDLYGKLAGMTDAEAMAMLTKLKGREMGALHHYAIGREAGAERERVLILMVMAVGIKGLNKLADKHDRRVKRIF